LAGEKVGAMVGLRVVWQADWLGKLLVERTDPDSDDKRVGWWEAWKGLSMAAWRGDQMAVKTVEH